MAQHSQTLTGDVDAFVEHLDAAIVSGSVTARAEHGINHQVGDARMLVRAYERFSVTGSSRVSLFISVLSVGSDLSVSAVATGGSQAVLLKMNTFGEEAFLELAVNAISSFERARPASYLDSDGL